MATIGLRNRRLRDLQCTVRERKRRVPAVYVVFYSRPSGVKVSIGIVWPIQMSSPCTALLHPTEHCPHRRIFQVIFWNRDRGELGGFPLQGMLLMVYTCHTKPYLLTNPSLALAFTHNLMQPHLTARTMASRSLGSAMK